MITILLQEIDASGCQLKTLQQRFGLDRCIHKKRWIICVVCIIISFLLPFFVVKPFSFFLRFTLRKFKSSIFHKTTNQENCYCINVVPGFFLGLVWSYFFI